MSRAAPCLRKIPVGGVKPGQIFVPKSDRPNLKLKSNFLLVQKVRLASQIEPKIYPSLREIQVVPVGAHLISSNVMVDSMSWPVALMSWSIVSVCTIFYSPPY